MAYLPPLNGGRINASIAGNTTGSSSASAVSTGTIVFAGGSNVTLSQSTGVNGATISFNAASQSVQTQNLHNLVIGGNTTGTTASISSGTLTLAGGNNITLSQAGGNAISIIGGAGGGGGGIVLYDGVHSITSGTASIAVAGALTASITNQTLSLSAPATSSVVGGGIVSLSTNGASVTISAPAFSAGISSNSTVSNQLILAAGNNITLSQSTNATGATVSIGVSNQSNQTLSFSAGSQSALTATGTFDARSYFLNGVGAASVGFSQSSVFVSVPTQSVESQSIGMHTSTAGGGTGGTSGSASGGQIRYNFYAGSNVTLSQSVNGASGSMSIYGSAGGAGGGVALYDGANSISSGTARFSNSNGVSFGFNGQTVTGSVAAQTNQTLGMYVLNNSVTNAQSSTSTLDARSISLTNYGALSAGFSAGSMQLSVPATSNLVGTNGISISSNGSTISVMPTLLSTYVNMLPASTASQTLGATNNTASLQFYPVSIPSPVAFDAIRIAFNASIVTTSNSSGNQTITHSFGLYSNNAGTLSLISSNSMGYSITGSSASLSISYATSTGTGGYGYASATTNGNGAIQSLYGSGGWRLVDLQFGNTMSITPGMYWLGMLQKASTANTGLGMSFGLVGNVVPSLSLGVFGSSSAAMTSNSSIKAPYMGLGLYNTTGALPNSAAISSINHSMNFMPFMTFIST